MDTLSGTDACGICPQAPLSGTDACGICPGRAGRMRIGVPGYVFDPMRLTDGIEPSADPILAARPKAYSVSIERRT